MKRGLVADAAGVELQDGYADSPYLLSDEAAQFLKFRTRHLFLKWAKRHRVPVCHRGRTLLYKRVVLEAFVEGRQWTHGRQSAASRGGSQ